MILTPITSCWDPRPRLRWGWVLAPAAAALVVFAAVAAGRVNTALVTIGYSGLVVAATNHVAFLHVADRQAWRRREGRVETDLRRIHAVSGAFLFTWIGMAFLVCALSDQSRPLGVAGALGVLLILCAPGVAVSAVVAGIAFARPSTLTLSRSGIECTARSAAGTVRWEQVESVTARKTPAGAMLHVKARPGVDVGPHHERTGDRMLPWRRGEIVLQWIQLDDPDEVFALIQECWELQDLPERWDVARSSG